MNSSNKDEIIFKHRGVVGQAQISPDERTLVVSTADSLVLWDLSTRKIKAQINHSFGRVYRFMFAPDQKTLWVRFTDHVKVKCFSLDAGKEIQLPGSGHEGSIRRILFTPHNRFLISASADSTIRIWNVLTGKEIHTLQLTEQNIPQSVTGISLSEDGKTLVAGGVNHPEVVFWDTQTWKIQARWPSVNKPNGPGYLQFVPHQNILALQSSFWGQNPYQEFSFCSFPDLKKLWDYPLSNQEHFLAFARDGSEFCSRTYTELRIWSTQQNRLLRSIPLTNGEQFAYSPDGMLLACPVKGSIEWIERSTGARRATFRGEAGEVFWNTCFSPDGKQVVTSSNKRICVWDLCAGKLLQEARVTQAYGSLAFSPNGKYFAAGGSNGTIDLWPADRFRAANADHKFTSQELNAAWQELRGNDAEAAGRAMQRLWSAPDQAAALIREKVKPVVLPTEQQMSELIADLDAKRFATREQATKDLQKLGPSADAALELALQKNPTPELGERLKRLLANSDTQLAMQAGDLRAVELLGWIGKGEAKVCLQELSRGSPGAVLTKAVRRILDNTSN
jgi:WD40 repeat protein